MFARYASPAQVYRQVDVDTSVESADPHRLIVLLFDGALSAIGRARLSMRAGDLAGKGTALSKAIQIVTEGLSASLDTSVGGELALNLRDLYDYIARRLAHANRHNDEAMLDEAIRLLSELREAWMDIRPAQSSTASTLSIIG
ncbi:MAG TPA: flagellar export chaperone FliS [Burkholderiaceae bacterium]|nr:flagellar export chaperone FliS [Burkholderiaceae bacterium]